MARGAPRGSVAAALGARHALRVNTPLKIDFVSDVACPWCVIGLLELEQAIVRTAADFAVTLECQPFELNPDMPREGELAAQHLADKYGSTPAQIAGISEQIRARGAELGFEFRFDRRERIYNTFDAHRLLYWTAVETGRQRELKHALFAAYFTAGADLSSADVLVGAALAAGLEGEAARAVLASGRYAGEVRERERYYRDRGIQAVPSVVIAGRHLIQGGQPSAVFEQALRRIASAEGVAR